MDTILTVTGAASLILSLQSCKTMLNNTLRAVFFWCCRNIFGANMAQPTGKNWLACLRI